MALPKIQKEKRHPISSVNEMIIEEEIIEEVSDEKGSEVEQKTKEARSIVLANLRVNRSGTLDELKSLSSEVLLKAPRNFFDKYEKLVDNITYTLQTKISDGGNSGLIASLRVKPDNLELKETVYRIIKSEYNKYESALAKYEYNRLGIEEKSIVFCMVFNEIVGLGPLEPLFQDFAIREIICNGPRDIQVEIKGEIVPVLSCKFRNKSHLQGLITRLYTTVNKDITVTNPMERARLTDNSRVFAVHESVAPDGPNLNIRRHTDDWVSSLDILNFNTVNVPLLVWLGNMIYSGLSFAVIGGTGTGKTTLLGALSGFYRSNARIVTVERNIELKVHPNKLKAAAMEVIPPRAGALRQGVNMRELVEATTQMRPDIIIVGEVTDGAAFDLLQAANTGHSISTTLHANTAQDATYRLMSLTAQAELVDSKTAYDMISAGLDLIVEITRFPQDGSRKVTGVYEVGRHPEKAPNGELVLPVYPIWVFDPVQIDHEDSIEIGGEWTQVGELSDSRVKQHHLGLTPNLTWEELLNVAQNEKRRLAE